MTLRKIRTEVQDAIDACCSIFSPLNFLEVLFVQVNVGPAWYTRSLFNTTNLKDLREKQGLLINQARYVGLSLPKTESPQYTFAK